MTGLEIMQAIVKRRIASSHNNRINPSESFEGRKRKGGFQCYRK